MAIEFQLDWDKAIACLVYLASHKEVTSLDKYKINKLVFLADKFHLVRYGRPVTGDFYCALEYGPIPSTILKRLDALEQNRDNELAKHLSLDRSFQYPRIKAKADPDMEQFSKSDLNALDRAATLFGKKTFAELKALTHEMPAYRKAWQARGEGKDSVKMDFSDFFEEDEEAVAGVFEEMIENDQLRKTFSPA